MQAFHPSLPLLVTSGADRLVALWHVPALEEADQVCPFAHIELPIWSSTHVHTDWVTSICWMTPTTLITSARATAQPHTVSRRRSHAMPSRIEDYELSMWQPDILRDPSLAETREEDLQVGVTTDLAFTTLDESTVSAGRSGWTPSIVLWRTTEHGGPYLVAPAGSGVRLVDLPSVRRGEDFLPANDRRAVRAVAAHGAYAVAVGEGGLVRLYKLQPA